MKIITDEKKIDEVLDRGTIVEILPTKEAFKERLMLGERLKFYIGFDATAPTLHLSHAKNFMLLEKFRRLGHEVIVLFGDFTARIGDPSGRDSARVQLTKEEVKKNVKEWKKLIEPLMGFNDKNNPPVIKYNDDWFSKMDFEDILKLASNFTVQQFLERDMFEKRMNEGKPIHLHEFMYPLMQGYDSVAMDVDVEMCGTDQTFNALVGRDLQRKINNKEKFVMVVTLMANPTTGEMMSKSRGVGVFLHVGAKDMFGQIMSQPDEMVEILFINCTWLSMDEIAEIMKEPNPRDAKIRLAEEITQMFYGEKEAKSAKENFIEVFSKKDIPDDMLEIEVKDDQVNLVDLLTDNKVVSSKSEVKRLMQQGAVKVNDEKFMDFNQKLDVDGEVVVRVGKLRFVRIKKIK